jgi:hypothetical protein
MVLSKLSRKSFAVFASTPASSASTSAESGSANAGARNAIPAGSSAGVAM